MWVRWTRIILIYIVIIFAAITRALYRNTVLSIHLTDRGKKHQQITAIISRCMSSELPTASFYWLLLWPGTHLPLSILCLINKISELPHGPPSLIFHLFFRFALYLSKHQIETKLFINPYRENDCLQTILTILGSSHCVSAGKSFTPTYFLYFLVFVFLFWMCCYPIRKHCCFSAMWTHVAQYKTIKVNKVYWAACSQNVIVS